MRRGMIFDLDGTLVDTNEAHAEAWRRTFKEFGYSVSLTRIFPEIGKGGDKLVPAILGEEAEARDGEAMRERVGESYDAIAQRLQFRVMPGSVELLRALRARGIRTALATSSRREYVDSTMHSAMVELRDLVDVVVTGSDAEATKPDPDLIVSAVRRLRVAPDQCVMVGDTPHDGEACRRANVSFWGVTCGGHDEETLRAAGAWRVWSHPAALLEELDEVLAA